MDKKTVPSPVELPSPVMTVNYSPVKILTSTAVKSMSSTVGNTSTSVVQTAGSDTSTGFRDTGLRAPEFHSSSQLTPCITIKNKPINTDKSVNKSIDTDMTENIATPSPVGATKGVK